MKSISLQLLRRMYHMQSEAYGSSDERCLATSKKLDMLEEAEAQQNGDFLESLDATNSNTSEERRPNIFRLLKSVTRKKTYDATA